MQGSDVWISKAMRGVARERFFPKMTHAFIVCKSEMQRVIGDLHVAFPPDMDILHAFAAKANPLKGVLEVARDCGMGCETASMGELTMAERVFRPDRVVFDSPVKTLEELEHALYRPMRINLDNFQELERVAAFHRTRPVVATVGLRINPQLGAGTIGALSTGVATSKFGIGLRDVRSEIVAAFASHAFLTMLHVHTGSQGIGLKMMVEGVKSIVALAEEIGPQVTTIDIGGGLPVNFSSDEYTPTPATYVQALQAEVPSLFNKQRFRIITEFGRCIVAKAGIMVSRVEYTKANGGRRIVQQHIGSDLALRTVWRPSDWPLRIAIYGPDGALKHERLAPTDVAGPCCLGGDLVGCNQMLPEATAMEDVVVVKDVGGYYHSSFSNYNLRQAPPVYLYDEATDAFTLIAKGRTVEETLAMFDC